jgi:tight adherence protein C
MTFSPLDALLYGAFGCLTVAFAIVGYALGASPPIVAPRLGARGFKRQQAIAKGGLFKLFEPLLRLLGGWLRYLPLNSLRRGADKLISEAGDYLGLTADELFAMCLLGAGGGVGVSYVLANFFADNMLVSTWFCGGIGTWMVLGGVLSQRSWRRSQISRSLPATLDLIALCMSAGLDFTSAIRRVIADSPATDDPLADELRWIVRELELGHTRQAALLAFAQRVPTPPVKEFVSVIVQSEKRGNPLRETLRIQSQVLKTRRTMMVEQAAQRAALMMVGPMLLTMVVIMILVGGPMVFTFLEVF